MGRASRIIGVLAIAAVAAGASVGEAAAAAAPVRISRVVYDPSGPDTHANSQIDREYVVIRNGGRRAWTLTGWTLRDTKNHVYTFGRFALKPGHTVTVHTGKGRNTATNLYEGRSWYIWNNTGDTAILRTAAGRTVSSCRWTSDRSGSISC